MRSGCFAHLQEEPPDPILGLTVAFAQDPRPCKVNLGAGVYKTAEEKSYILQAVKQAEHRLWTEEKSKDYLPIDGLETYIRSVRALIWKKGEKLDRIYGAQTPGGTAALRVGGAFLKELGFNDLYVSDPTWVNHLRVFQHVGFQVHTYPYFHWTKQTIDFPGIVQKVESMRAGSIMVLQVSCHNPTGLDLSLPQWEELFVQLERKKIFPFFDLAYQGLGRDMVSDVEPLELFMKTGLRGAVAVSHAKNFGLYAERCGALFVICSDSSEAERVGSSIRVLVRGLYSNPPCHGSRIVSTILHSAELTALWQEELTAMRHRIADMRAQFIHELQKKSPLSAARFRFMSAQKGMFSYTCLTEEQVQHLISHYGIYLPQDGRINVAGLNTGNLSYVVDAIIESIQHKA